MFTFVCLCVPVAHGSASAVTWERYHSSLVSGQGLLSVGGSGGSVEKEVKLIHKENVEKLSQLSESEILQEQGRIRNALGQW